MRSALVYTDSIENTASYKEIALNMAGELREKLELGKNSCGILFCDTDFLPGDFVETISAQFDFPIVGGTAMATFTTNGYHNYSAQLLVMTGDDCTFSTAITEDINSENYRQEITQAFNAAKEGLHSEDGKCLFVLSTFDASQTADFAPFLSDLSGGLPVFGGLVSDYMEFDKYRLIYNGAAFSQRAILIMVGGNVRPIYSLFNKQSVVGKMLPVTKSDGHMIQEVNGKTFFQYFQDIGFDKNALEQVAGFYIIRARYKDEQGRTYQVNRAVEKIDPVTGWAHCFAPVPVGTDIAYVAVTRKDIEHTCAQGISHLIDQIKVNQTDDYKYSTVFAASCTFRHIILAHSHTSEGDIIRNFLPEGLELTGFYTFGEFAPIKFADGGEKSRLLNCTIAFFAM